MSKDTGGPAFPYEFGSCNKGMTLRDYFAAKAMQGWLSTYGDDLSVDGVGKSGVAVFAYEMADAMLKARNQ